MKVLFVGRFQPVHKGHVYAIEEIIKRHHIVIAIGSIGKRNRENPFSFKERKEMLSRSIKGKFEIIGIRDNKSDDTWLGRIKNKCSFDAVATGNPRVKEIFSGRGFKVIKPKMHMPEKYDASKIRRLIREGREWRHLVPAGAKKIIEKHLLHSF